MFHVKHTERTLNNDFRGICFQYTMFHVKHIYLKLSGNLCVSIFTKSP